jgi:hypothetical protein
LAGERRRIAGVCGDSGGRLQPGDALVVAAHWGVRITGEVSDTQGVEEIKERASLGRLGLWMGPNK